MSEEISDQDRVDSHHGFDRCCLEKVYIHREAKDDLRLAIMFVYAEIGFPSTWSSGTCFIGQDPVEGARLDSWSMPIQMRF